MKSDDQACPCGAGEPFDDCCGPLISGTAIADSALRLMRSRFTAYSLGDSDYILATWHSTTRPQQIDLDTTQKWMRLKIIASTADTVEFIATFKVGGKAGRLHERSRFLFEDGRWFYVDGQLRDV